MAQQTYCGDVTDVTVVARLGRRGLYNRIWQPFVACWREGHLLVAYGEHLTGKTDMGNIVCAISIDDGMTWEEPVMVFDHRAAPGSVQVAYSNPVLYRPPGQDLVWCFAMRCPTYYPDSEDSQLCAAYSSDGGRSWQPVELSVNYHGSVITCAGFVRTEHSDGPRYLLPVHRNTLRHDPSGDQAQLVLESTSLLEWQLAGFVPQPAVGRVFMHEGNIAIGDAADELKMVMRTATCGQRAKALDPPVAFSSVSRDGGRVWTPGSPERALHNTVSKAFYGRSTLGYQIYVFSDGPLWERKALAYKVKAEGEDWCGARVFYDGGNCNSYPTLLEYSPGAYYAVWDSSDDPKTKRTCIRFGKLSIE